MVRLFFFFSVRSNQCQYPLCKREVNCSCISDNGVARCHFLTHGWIPSCELEIFCPFHNEQELREMLDRNNLPERGNECQYPFCTFVVNCTCSSDNSLARGEGCPRMTIGLLNPCCEWEIFCPKHSEQERNFHNSHFVARTTRRTVPVVALSIKELDSDEKISLLISCVASEQNFFFFPKVVVVISSETSMLASSWNSLVSTVLEKLNPKNGM